MQAAKINFSGYLQQQVLFSLDHLKKLFEMRQDVKFYNVSSIQNDGDKPLSIQDFLVFYEKYLGDLFQDGNLSKKTIQENFSLALSTSALFFHKQPLSLGRCLLKLKRSCIQMQPLGLFVSSLDQSIHFKSFAKEAQSFGIRFNFPTIYEDTMCHEIIELPLDDTEYTLFNVIRQFVRHHTKPLTIYDGKEKKVYPIRYSDDLKENVLNMSFFKKHGLTVLV
jgi:hypothetical protein